SLVMQITRVASVWRIALAIYVLIACTGPSQAQSFKCCPVGTYLNTDGECKTICPSNRIDDSADFCAEGLNPDNPSICLGGEAPDSGYDGGSIPIVCKNDRVLVQHPICAFGEQKVMGGCVRSHADVDCAGDAGGLLDRAFTLPQAGPNGCQS